VAPVLVLLAYLVGGIPFGVVFARLRGVDVRRAGSGNIGATNVARSAGIGPGVATLVADVLKGALPALTARALGVGPGVEAAVAFAAVAGHVFPLALGLAGGKGVATALGVLGALCPLATLAAVAAFLLVLVAWRYVSLASIAAAVTAPIAVALLRYPRPLLVAAIAVAGLVVARHAGNLRRLRAGTEPRIEMPKRQASLPD
jgi:glycerol-3-phosphate acyltransferase PlsY